MVIFKSWEAQRDFSPKQPWLVPVSAEIQSPKCHGSRERSLLEHAMGGRGMRVRLKVPGGTRRLGKMQTQFCPEEIKETSRAGNLEDRNEWTFS